MNGDVPLCEICSYQKLDAGLGSRGQIPAKSSFGGGGLIPEPAGRFHGCFAESRGIWMPLQDT